MQTLKWLEFMTCKLYQCLIQNMNRAVSGNGFASEQGLMQVCLHLVFSIRIRNILDKAVLWHEQGNYSESSTGCIWIPLEFVIQWDEPRP